VRQDRYRTRLAIHSLANEMTRPSLNAENSTDPRCKSPPLMRIFVATRVTAVIGMAMALLAYLHRQLHAYPEYLPHSPLAQAMASALLLTLLAYLIILSLPRQPLPKVRGLVVIFAWMLLLSVGHALSHHGMHDAESIASSMRDTFGSVGIATLAVAYTIALAIPFVPGVELGLVIIALFGPVGAITAYVATVTGLTLAYAVGHILPQSAIVALLDRIGIALPVDGIEAAMYNMVRAANPHRGLRHRFAELLIKYRYLALAVCLNFPGNSIVGGGGGLALLSGASRQFTWRSFVLTVVLAVAPVPLLVLAGFLNVAALLKQQGLLHNLLVWIDRFITYLAS